VIRSRAPAVQSSARRGLPILKEITMSTVINGNVVSAPTLADLIRKIMEASLC